MLTLSTKAANDIADRLAFHKSELLPAITIQHDTNELLMQAWMNRDAVIETLTSGQVCYYSRSRKGLWRKGETSGHTQRLVTFRTDCDYDSLSLLVEQTGVACHTKRYSCFYNEVQEDGTLRIISEPQQ